jgi:hypothetical protein
MEMSELGSVEHGLIAARIREREEGVYAFQITRTDRENLRDFTGTFTIILAPGTPEERLVTQEVVLSRTSLTTTFSLAADGTLTRVGS